MLRCGILCVDGGRELGLGRLGICMPVRLLFMLHRVLGEGCRHLGFGSK